MTNTITRPESSRRDVLTNGLKLAAGAALPIWLPSQAAQQTTSPRGDILAIGGTKSVTLWVFEG